MRDINIFNIDFLNTLEDFVSVFCSLIVAGTIFFFSPFISFAKSRSHIFEISFTYASFKVAFVILFTKGNANFATTDLPSIEDKSS